jgi:hypothetical protein
MIFFMILILFKYNDFPIAKDNAKIILS